MSNNENTKLLERASEMIDYWTGTMFADVLESLIEANDLDELRIVVARAELEANHESKGEAYAEAQDKMTDERASEMFREMPDVF